MLVCAKDECIDLYIYREDEKNKIKIQERKERKKKCLRIYEGQYMIHRIIIININEIFKIEIVVNKN
jgi:hypothetical protein